MKGSTRRAGGFGFGVLVAVVAGMMLPSAGQASPNMAWAPVDPPGPAVSESSLPPGANVPGTAQNTDPTPSIVGGNETTFDHHPWLVQITLNGSAHCGGALVHPMIVLTAAHCLWSGDYNDWWGDLALMQAFTSRTLSGTGGEELNIAGWGAADNYQPLPGTGENDWGILALASPSSRPLLKIAGPDERALWRAGRTALVAGFGNVSQGGAASPVLKELNVPLLDDSVCSAANSYGTSFHVGNMLCAGIVQGGSGTCQGDSGGPLSVPTDDGNRRIVGVVSFGDGCAKPNKPTIYSRVAEPGVSTQINALAQQAAQYFNFPGVYADSNVLGAGARPAGCSAAQGAASQAQAAVNSASRKLSRAKKGVTKARKTLRKATRKKRAKAKRAVRKAKRAVRTANTKVKGAKSSLRTAKSNLTAANGQAAAACN